MGCIQSKASANNEESRRLTRENTPGKFTNSSSGQRPPSNLDRLSTHIPQRGPLSEEQYWARLDFSPSQTAKSGNVTLNFAFVSQRGYYPDSPDKPNQDAVYVKKNYGGVSDQHFFGVFDGHGTNGDSVANFAKYKVPENALEFPGLGEDPEAGLKHSMTWTNEQLHHAGLGDEMSGTTAVACLFQGETAWIANVGDSRAILISKGKDEILQVEALSEDQTPFRKDELARVRAAGASVLSLDQVEGTKDRDYEDWTEETDAGDPPRIWKPGQMYPGTAFTRSIGDRIAEEVGVIAEPEIRSLRIQPEHQSIVIASDGVTEFLSNEKVAELISEFDDPQEAAIALVAESYQFWLQYETRTDDISAIVIYIRHPEPEPTVPPVSQKMPSASGTLPTSKSLNHLASQNASTGIHSQIPSSSNLSGLTERSKSTLQTALSRKPSHFPAKDSIKAGSSQRLQDVIGLGEFLPEESGLSSRRLNHSLSEPRSLMEKLSASQNSVPLAEDPENPGNTENSKVIGQE